MKIRNRIDISLSYLFGHDVFISYGRSDAFEYAAALAEKIAALRMTVLFDQLGSPAGRAVPRSILRQCHLSRMMVVIGSPAACSSKAVADEVLAFPVTERPVVAVSVAGSIDSASWRNRVVGVAPCNETTEALAQKKPSAEVLERIKAAAKFTRRETVQNRAVIGTAALTISLISVAVMTGFWLRSSLTELTLARVSLNDLALKMRDAEKQYKDVQAQAAAVEQETRLELGRSATNLASRPGQERRAVQAGLVAVSAGKWFKGAASPEAIKGLTDAVAAIWYSLPLEDVPPNITGAAFSADSKTLLADGPKGKVAWSTVSGRRVPLTQQHPASSPPDVSTGPEGPTILEIEGNAAFLKDRATGAVIRRLEGYEGSITRHAFARNRWGTFLATGTDRGTLQLWNANSGEQIATLEGHSKEPYFERFVPLDESLSRGMLSKSGGRVYQYSNIGINSIAFAPASLPLLISGANDRTARIWDVRAPRRPSVLGGHELAIMYADFSPSAKLAVSASEDGEVRLWGIDGRPLAQLRYHRAPITRITFNADETRIATFSRDDSARIWRPTHDEAVRTFDDRSAQLERVALSPDGRFIAASSQVDEHSRVWEVESGKLISRLRVRPAEGAERPPPYPGMLDKPEPFRYGYPYADRLGNGADRGNSKYSLDAGPVFSSDGSRLLSQDDTLLVCWDAKSWSPVSRFDGHIDTLSAAAFSPDGSLVVSGDNGDKSFLWSTHTGKMVAELKVASTVSAVAFSPDGSRFATSSYGGGTSIWDAQTGKSLLLIDSEGQTSTWVQYSRNGEELLIADSGFAWRIVDSATGKVKRRASGPQADGAMWSQDGRFVVTWSATQATVWSADSARALSQLTGHTAQISSAQFSADGARVVTGSWDEYVRVWDTGSGKELSVLRGHLGRVNDIVISPKGNEVATASMDGTVKLFPIALDDFVIRARAAME